MPVVGVQRHREPGEIVGYDPPGVLPPEEPAGAAVLGLGAVAVQVAVMNLAFVAVHGVARQTAEKDSRIEPLAVDEAFQLEREIRILPLAFEHSAAVLDVQPAFPGHGEYAGQIGECLPAGQVPAVQQALHAERLELDVAEFDLAGVELEADVAAAERGGVGVVEHDLAAKLDDKMAPLGGHVEGLPVAAAVLAIDGLPLDEAAGWKRVCARVRDVQLIAAGFHVGWDRRRPQENAAIGSGGAAKIDLQLEVAELAGRVKQAVLTFGGGDRAVDDLPIDLGGRAPAKQGFAVKKQNPAVGHLFRREGIRLRRPPRVCESEQCERDQTDPRETKGTGNHPEGSWRGEAGAVNVRGDSSRLRGGDWWTSWRVRAPRKRDGPRQRPTRGIAYRGIAANSKGNPGGRGRSCPPVRQFAAAAASGRSGSARWASPA